MVGCNPIIGRMLYLEGQTTISCCVFHRHFVTCLSHETFLENIAKQWDRSKTDQTKCGTLAKGTVKECLFYLS